MQLDWRGKLILLLPCIFLFLLWVLDMIAATFLGVALLIYYASKIGVNKVKSWSRTGSASGVS